MKKIKKQNPNVPLFKRVWIDGKEMGVLNVAKLTVTEINALYYNQRRKWRRETK